MPDARPDLTCTAILVAAGSSQRMGFDKLAAPVAGIPVLTRALLALLATPSITRAIVVCPPERWPLVENAARGPKPVVRVDGGASRQESVARGLAAVAPDVNWVAVHDGARPLVSPEDVESCIAAARACRAASLARRVTETLHRADADDFGVATVDRDHLWSMETPQVFARPLLLDACRRAHARGLCLTDEVSAAQAAGVAVKFVASRHPNLKITTPADLALAAALLHSRA